MAHSHIFPFLVYSVVKLLFYTSFYWKCPSSSHVFVKCPVDIKYLAHAELSYSHSGIFVTLSLTLEMDISNLWLHCCGFTQASFHRVMNTVGHAITHTRSRDLDD